MITSLKGVFILFRRKKIKLQTIINQHLIKIYSQSIDLECMPEVRFDIRPFFLIKYDFVIHLFIMFSSAVRWYLTGLIIIPLCIAFALGMFHLCIAKDILINALVARYCCFELFSCASLQ